MSLWTGLYGDEGILPVRLQMPKVQRPLLEQESLLGLGPSLGLEPQQVLELTCLVGVALALCAVLLEPLRDSLIYFCLWFLYLSLYNVSIMSCYILSNASSKAYDIVASVCDYSMCFVL